MDGARAAYQQAIDSGHADAAPMAAVNLGELLAEQGDADGAKAAYQQAIDSGHADAAPTAAVNLGELLAEQGDADGARAAYQQAIDSGHADAAPTAAVYLGELLAEQGDADGARAAYQQAIDSGHPDEAAARVYLGQLLAEQPGGHSARNLLEEPSEHRSAQELPADDSAPRFPEGSTVRVPQEGDRVECSVFAPPVISPGSTFMIQAFAHISSQTREAIRRAKEFDADAVRRAVKTLEASVLRGTMLSFHLTMPGLQVDDPVQSMVWRGTTESVQFGISVSKVVPSRQHCRYPHSVPGLDTDRTH